MIYLIKSNNWLKIGFSNNLETRLKSYSTLNPEYELISVREGNQKDEFYLHSIFKSLEVNGEWMSYNEIIIKLFNNILIPSENSLTLKLAKNVEQLNKQISYLNKELQYYKNRNSTLEEKYRKEIVITNEKMKLLELREKSIVEEHKLLKEEINKLKQSKEYNYTM